MLVDVMLLLELDERKIPKLSPVPLVEMVASEIVLLELDKSSIP